MVRPTDMVELFEQVGGIIITGASDDAATLVLNRLNLARMPERLFTGLNTEGKADILNRYGGGIVFEDSINVAKYLKENTTWTVNLVL